jgi:hypothetical protein
MCFTPFSQIPIFNYLERTSLSCWVWLLLDPFPAEDLNRKVLCDYLSWSQRRRGTSLGENPYCTWRIDVRNNHLLLATIGLVAATFICGTPVQAQATRTWVSGVGDDAKPCSRTAPCKTFAGAISKTATGGYIDCLDLGGFGAGTITKAITIQCQKENGYALNTNGGSLILVDVSNGANVTLRGLIAGMHLGPMAGASINAGLNLVSVENSNNGVVADGTCETIDVSIRASSFVGSSGIGIQAASTTAAVVAIVDSTTSASNRTGVNANGSAGFVQVGDPTVTSKTMGVSATAGMSVQSFKTNQIVVNDSNETPLTAVGSAATS